MHRAINPVHDGDPAPQPACVYDLDREVHETIAIKVTDVIDRVQVGGEPESASEPRRPQRAVRPEGDASEGGWRELGTGGRRAEEDDSG